MPTGFYSNAAVLKTRSPYSFIFFDKIAAPILVQRAEGPLFIRNIGSYLFVCCTKFKLMNRRSCVSCNVHGTNFACSQEIIDSHTSSFGIVLSLDAALAVLTVVKHRDI